MDVERAGAILAAGAVALDLRDPAVFAREHIPGSINLMFGADDLADRAEIYLERERRYVLIAAGSEGAEAEGILRDRGFRVEGTIGGGMEAWRRRAFRTVDLATIPGPQVFDGRFEGTLIDVRESFEFAYGHIPGARSHPASDPWEQLERIAGQGPHLLVCAGHHRSTFVASVLKRAGRSDIAILEGGITAWRDAGYPVHAATSGLPTAV